MTYSVLLDAGVLLPGYARNTLLHVAAQKAYRPLWTRQIWECALQLAISAHPQADPTALQSQMLVIQTTFDDAMVDGWEHLVSTMTNPPHDRHVLAAAVAGNADGVVTTNMGSFPASARQPYGVALYSLDEFLVDQLSQHTGEVLSALMTQAARLRENAYVELSVEDILDILKEDLPNFSEQVADTLQLWGAA
ncbi:PIN domain-containing protein [Streptomyces sp. NPDC059690]|uniref:PIN domain-containing protein n=1 Tax=Streptomyces sp. NPDC059690 TaxID=3346907 RepID=UPI00369D0F7C